MATQWVVTTPLKKLVKDVVTSIIVTFLVGQTFIKFVIANVLVFIHLKSSVKVLWLAISQPQFFLMMFSQRKIQSLLTKKNTNAAKLNSLYY